MSAIEVQLPPASNHAVNLFFKSITEGRKEFAKLVEDIVDHATDNEGNVVLDDDYIENTCEAYLVTETEIVTLFAQFAARRAAELASEPAIENETSYTL